MTKAVAGDRLRYRAPEGCPTQAEFAAAVAARGGHFESRDPADDTKFDVGIVQRADGFHASLAVASGASTSNPREVQAPSCAEVVDALAVVTAIALNPPLAAAAKPAEPAPPAPVAAKTAPPPLRGASGIWTKTVKVDAGELRLDHSLAITAFLGSTLGIVPRQILPRLDIGVSRANFVSVPGGQSYLLGTIARLHASLLFDRTFQFGGLSTQIGAQELGASLCASPHYDTAGWVMLACAEISVGLVGIRTKDAQGNVTQDKTQGFGALGIGAESSYNFGSHFQLGLRLGMEALTSRITAERPDGSELFHSSPVILSAMLGAGTHF